MVEDEAELEVEEEESRLEISLLGERKKLLQKGVSK
jgi:hypothetical protein